MLAQLLIVVASFLAVSNSLVFESGAEYSTKCLDGNDFSCKVIPGKTADSIAFGTYIDEITKDGWGKIFVHTTDKSLNSWYEAGFLEGALTSDRIYQHFISWYEFQFGPSSPITEEVKKFILDQYDYAVRLTNKKDNLKDPYYVALKKLLVQLQGILDGQNYAVEDPAHKMSLLDLLLLNASGDLYDIVPALHPAEFKLKVGKVPAEEFFDLWHKQISCSALIKMNDNKSDVFAAHTTWSSYQNMLRVYKNYDFENHGYQLSSSGKPGFVYSKDDFYVLPVNNMVVIETTNGIMNPDMYKLVTSESLLTWQRIPTVNYLATSGKQWTDLVARHNSGTYANQWMVLDLKHFKPNVGITSDADFLWITELAPGVAVAHDVTQVFIKNGNVWPSYNVPYDPYVYNISGFNDAYAKYGDQYSYQNCPRAKIFQRDHSKVQSFEDMQHMIRYNRYFDDELSLNNPANAIASRYDLRETNTKAYGSVDGKVTSFTAMNANHDKQGKRALVSAQNGPTHDDIAPFQWSATQFNSLIHAGQPDTFDFPFVQMDFNRF